MMLDMQKAQKDHEEFLASGETGKTGKMMTPLFIDDGQKGNKVGAIGRHGSLNTRGSIA